MKKINNRIIIVLLFVLPLKSNAWGLLGHRIVGEVASKYLNPAAKAAVMKILGTETMAMASNYPDFIKSDSNYNYLYNWHYINLRGGLSRAQFDSVLSVDTASNAYTRINQIVKQLKSKKLTAVERSLYLKLLIHIVGDIHQPLHVGRYEDLGGNRIKILWFNVPYNLHQVWDEQLIKLQELSYTEFAAAINHTTQSQRIAWQKQPVSEWIWDSYQLAEKVYSDIKLPEEKLGYNYNFKYKAILEQQLLKGGVHLAGLLNEIFSVKKGK
jgi:hypothetical protein